MSLPQIPACRLALLGLLVSLAPGCGYSAGYRVPPGVRSIAVPVFNNATFPLRREVELDLTSALRKEILTRTTLRLAEASEADLAVFGTILELRERLVAEGRADQKTESSISIEVDLIVEDYLSSRQWREKVSVREPLSVQIGETFDVARSRAIGNLAEKILEQIEFWEGEGSG